MSIIKHPKSCFKSIKHTIYSCIFFVISMILIFVSLYDRKEDKTKEGTSVNNLNNEGKVMFAFGIIFLLLFFISSVLSNYYLMICSPTLFILDTLF